MRKLFVVLFAFIATATFARSKRTAPLTMTTQPTTERDMPQTDALVCPINFKF